MESLSIPESVYPFFFYPQKEMRQCIFLQSIPYLFHKDDSDEARILAEILEMQQHYSRFEVIPELELDGFINDARDLFDKQMKNLQKKTA